MGQSMSDLTKQLDMQMWDPSFQQMADQQAGDPPDLKPKQKKMADGLNRVILLGNLGADPELRYTQGGTAVLNLRLATSETYVSDGNKKQRTEWHNVVVWAKRAEGLSRILSKGDRILVEGSIRTSSYESRDGSGKRYKTEIHVSNVVLSGGNGSNQQQQPPQQQAKGNRRPPQQQAKGNRRQPKQQPVEDADFDSEDYDDIPF